MKRRIPFQPPTSTKLAVQASLTKLLVEKHRLLTEAVLSPQNMLRYAHGSRWRHLTDIDGDEGAMEAHSAEMTLPFDRIVAGDAALILESVNSMSEDFHNQLMQSMYALINRTCEKTGNSVQATRTTFPEAFEEMLEKIEFGVDRDGKVTMPELHTADADWARGTLDAQPPEYHERIQKLIDRKTSEAKEKELLRKSKFTAGQE